MIGKTNEHGSEETKELEEGGRKREVFIDNIDKWGQNTEEGIGRCDRGYITDELSVNIVPTYLVPRYWSGRKTRYRG